MIWAKESMSLVFIAATESINFFNIGDISPALQGAMGLEPQVLEEPKVLSFQLFRIKPFGWGLKKARAFTTHGRPPRFQLFRIKPFGWAGSNLRLNKSAGLLM